MNRETVIKLSKLSALALSEEETDLLCNDMNKIMEFASEIENSDEETGVLLNENKVILREDNIKASYNREDILKNAPTSHNGFFKLLRRNV